MRVPNYDEESHKTFDSNNHEKDNNPGLIIIGKSSKAKLSNISSSLQKIESSKSITMSSERPDTVANIPTVAKLAHIQSLYLRNVIDDPEFISNFTRSRCRSNRSNSELCLSSGSICILQLDEIIQNNDSHTEDDTDYIEESGQVPEPLTLKFALKLIFRLFTRIGDLGTDIWVLHIAYVTEGQEEFFVWLLCFQFLPIPLLLIQRWMSIETTWSFLSTILLDILHISQLKELYRSLMLGVFTDDFFIIHSTEALLTGFPEAVLQWLAVLGLEDQGVGWTQTKIMLLVSTLFSAISVGNSMNGFEAQIHDIQGVDKSACSNFLSTLLLMIYFALDVLINLYIIALGIHFYIPWGCVVLTWRYFYRSTLNFAVYYNRGSIWRQPQPKKEVDSEETSHSCAAMLIFGFLAAGPIQFLTDLPFNHDLAFRGGKWLFALHFGAVVDFAAILAIVYMDDGIINLYWLIACLVMQVSKGILDLTIYVPMLLAENTAAILEIVEDNVHRRLSRLAKAGNSKPVLQRANSLPSIRSSTGIKKVTDHSGKVNVVLPESIL